MTWQWWETDAWHEHRWLRVAAWLAWVVAVLVFFTWGVWA